MKYVLLPAAVLDEGDSSPSTHFARAHGARESYIRTLLRLGLTPLFASPLTPVETAIDLLSHCQGLLLLGGGDIDPALYGEVSHPETRITEPERDRFEIALAQAAVNLGIPVLGICRGCQILGVAFGGKLIQHIPDVVTTEQHSSQGYRTIPAQKRHPIMLDTNSRAFALLQKEELLVNSAHHQAVGDAGPHLTVVARSPEGIAEIIEHRDPGVFCFGVQSHPEVDLGREHSAEETLLPLFQAFAAAIQECSGG